MDCVELKKGILRLLETSTISDHHKKCIRDSFDNLDPDKSNDILRALRVEQKKMAKLDEKQKRVELKYKVMVEKLQKSTR